MHSEVLLQQFAFVPFFTVVIRMKIFLTFSVIQSLPNFVFFAVGCLTSGFTFYIKGEIISNKFVKHLDSAFGFCH